LDEGLGGDNSEAVEKDNSKKSYTALEHAWDEGFGYFGAARDYAEQEDADIKAGVQSDTNGDGKIDFTSEYNFGASVNAAKRDVGSDGKTDFTADAIAAFLTGRVLISEEAPLADIKAEADKAVKAWENAIAATAVHYVNDSIGDIALIESDSADYDLATYAKHWSELKGFALSFQFNPNSPMSAADFKTLHEKIGDKPVLLKADVGAYKTALEEARTLMQDAYGFDKDVVENW
jgi:hypothetical protein